MYSLSAIFTPNHCCESQIREAMGKILARGHSRVPVYSGNPKNIIGLLLVGVKSSPVDLNLVYPF